MTTVISILGGSLYRSIRRLPHAGDGNAVILCVPYRATAEKTGEDQTVSLDHDYGTQLKPSGTQASNNMRLSVAARAK